MSLHHTREVAARRPLAGRVMSRDLVPRLQGSFDPLQDLFPVFQPLPRGDVNRPPASRAKYVQSLGPLESGQGFGSFLAEYRETVALRCVPGVDGQGNAKSRGA